MAEISYIGLFLMIFFIAVVGVSLVQPVAQQVGTASSSEGIDGTASATIIDLSTLMFIILIVGSLAGIVIFAMQLIGM